MVKTICYLYLLSPYFMATLFIGVCFSPAVLLEKMKKERKRVIEYSVKGSILEKYGFHLVWTKTSVGL